MPNSNHFIWGDYDIEAVYDELDAGRLSSNAMAYITIASLKDPVSPHIAPAGHTNLQIMTLAPRDYAVWNVDKGPTEGGRYHRDPDYRKRKEALTDHLIDVSQQVIPDLREHIVWKEAATPVSQERFTQSTGGTSYGIEMSCSQAGPMRVGPRTRSTGCSCVGRALPPDRGSPACCAAGCRPRRRCWAGSCCVPSSRARCSAIAARSPSSTKTGIPGERATEPRRRLRPVGVH
jgi:phytoene dehydrogenase-like protein